MGTRCGSLDPGAVLWLAGHVDDQVDIHRLLEEQSGLMGLCGTADMREVHAAVAAGDRDAQLAFDVWRHRIITLAGACVAALGGLDALAFTGGIGENDPAARAALVEGLAWLGAAVADRPTEVGDREITASGSGVRCFVIPAREDLQLAAEAEARLAG
jgi:acetate kinase